jgi:lysozyme
MKLATALALRPVPEWLPDWVKLFEGLHDGDPTTAILEAKRDPVGFWTVGWGHLVTRDLAAPRPAPITMEEAEALLAADLATAARAVLRLVRVSLTDGQYEALIDFAYNAGAGNLEISTLRRVINRGDYAGAPEQLMRWVHASAVKLPGLVRRRAAEAELWESYIKTR